jgi:lipid-binding SYLF domain-containing protein
MVRIHTIGFGFLAGMDVYDAVLVLRTRKAVDAFTRPKVLRLPFLLRSHYQRSFFALQQVSLGAELAIAAGPVGGGAMLDTGIEASPVFSYVKSKVSRLPNPDHGLAPYH